MLWLKIVTCTLVSCVVAAYADYSRSRSGDPLESWEHRRPPRGYYDYERKMRGDEDDSYDSRYGPGPRHADHHHKHHEPRDFRDERGPYEPRGRHDYHDSRTYPKSYERDSRLEEEDGPLPKQRHYRGGPPSEPTERIRNYSGRSMEERRKNEINKFVEKLDINAQKGLQKTIAKLSKVNDMIKENVQRIPKIVKKTCAMRKAAALAQSNTNPLNNNEKILIIRNDASDSYSSSDSSSESSDSFNFDSESSSSNSKTESLSSVDVSSASAKSRHSSSDDDASDYISEIKFPDLQIPKRRDEHQRRASTPARRRPPPRPRSHRRSNYRDEDYPASPEHRPPYKKSSNY